MKIVYNGYSTHLVIDDQTPASVALAHAMFEADRVMSSPHSTQEQITAVREAWDHAEAAFCRHHGMRFQTAHRAMLDLEQYGRPAPEEAAPMGMAERIVGILFFAAMLPVVAFASTIGG